MIKKTYLWPVTLVSSLLFLAQNTTVSVAQTRGSSSSDFFNQGNQQMQQQIQNLQNPPPQPNFTKQQTDLNLDQSSQDQPDGKEISAPDPANDQDNNPTSPEDEFEFKM